MKLEAFTLFILLTMLLATTACSQGSAPPESVVVTRQATPTPTLLSPTALPAPTLPPTISLPGSVTVAVPQGNPPLLDGTLSRGEWDGARQEKFSDSSELLLMQNGGYLYLGIRVNLHTIWSVYLDRGDEIAVLHSSGSLGTAVYKCTESSWQRTRTFGWTLQDKSNSETARQQRKQFLEQEGWLASLGTMGKPEEVEFQLAMPQGALRLAVAFPWLPSFDKAAVWPVGLDDDVRNMDLLEGDAPAQARFSPERWGVVMVAGYETAGPAATEEPVPATISPVSPTAVPAPPTSAAVLPTRTNASALAVISVDTAGQVERLSTLSGHHDKVNDLSFSGDGAYLASSSLDRTIKLWDVASWQEVNAFSMNKAGFNGIAFSPDGRLLASADAIWDVENGQAAHMLERGRNDPGPVAFSPDGSTLAVALEGRPIKLWDVASGEVRRTFAGPADDVTFSIAFSPDGQVLATGVHGGMVRLWDVASGQVAGTLEQGNQDDDVHDVAFSPDGRILASGGNDCTVYLWDVASRQAVHILRLGDGLYGLAFSPDGAILATAGCDRTVKLWDVESGKMLRSLPHDDELLTVAFSPDGTLLASGGYDNQIYLWGISR